MKEFFLSVISGAVGGLIVFYVQKHYEAKAKKEQEDVSKIINPESVLKVLPSNILSYLRVGLGVEKMKDFLGVPYVVSDSVYLQLFDYQEVDVKSYFYKFRNATLVVLSTDNLQIDSISIFNHSSGSPLIEVDFYGYDPLIVGESTVSEEFVQGANNHFNHIGNKENFFGIENYFGWPGNHMYYSCFGFFSNYETAIKYEQTRNAHLFAGEIITGVCISNRQGYAPYISTYQ